MPAHHVTWPGPARDQGGRLFAVSVCDTVGDALSSVYCYYDPDERRRALGTFMALAEIAQCRRLALRWLSLSLACSLFAVCSVYSWYPKSIPGRVVDFRYALIWELLRWNLWLLLAALITGA